MTQKEYREFRKVVAAVLKNFGMSNLTDDVTQHILMQNLRGIGKKQLDKYKIIDAVRSLLGDSRSMKYKKPVRVKLDIAKVELSHKPNYLDDIINNQKFYKMFSEIDDEKDREVFVLKVKHGLSNVEIAEVMGVTGSMISHRLKRLGAIFWPERTENKRILASKNYKKKKAKELILNKTILPKYKEQ